MTLPDLARDDVVGTLERVLHIARVAGQVKEQMTEGRRRPEHRELILSPRGFRTGLLDGRIEIRVDLLQQELRVVSTDGRVQVIDLSGSGPANLTGEVTEALGSRGTAVSLDVDGPSDASAALETARVAGLMQAWGRFHQAFVTVREQVAAPAGEVTLDPDTLDLGVRLYSGLVPPGADGPGETIRVWLSHGLTSRDEGREAAFMAELTPAAARPGDELRPAGAVWDADGSRARLVYRAIAPRRDWETALGWFCESSVAALARAARWDVRALSPAVAID